MKFRRDWRAGREILQAYLLLAGDAHDHFTVGSEVLVYRVAR
jgi:hypothetical protein